MVLGESFKPFSTKPKTESIILEKNLGKIEEKRILEIKNEGFIFKYTLSFLAASCAETSIQLMSYKLCLTSLNYLINYINLISL
jgi:hypothetical protein